MLHEFPLSKHAKQVFLVIFPCIGSILSFFPEVSSGTQKIDGHARRLGDSWVYHTIVRAGGCLDAGKG